MSFLFLTSSYDLSRSDSTNQNFLAKILMLSKLLKFFSCANLIVERPLLELDRKYELFEAL